MGPTATGKTDAAAHLYERVEAEIISVDSSLVYRDMNIGTAKPEKDFLAQYPHHLIDVKHPNDSYSVAQFYQDCTELIAEITEAGKIPILAGGTMFYFNALENGLNELPQADAKLRAEIDHEAQALGWPALHKRLAVLDSSSAERIDPMDSQRIQRALEIVLAGGKPVDEHNDNRKPPLSNPMLKIALSFSDRKLLHSRIEQRFDAMLDAGLQHEVRTLLANGVDPDAPSMRMIGYRQMLEYINGGVGLDVMRNKGIAATRQLAKRQLTWLRNQSNVLWWVDNGLLAKDYRVLGDTVIHFV